MDSPSFNMLSLAITNLFFNFRESVLSFLSLASQVHDTHQILLPGSGCLCGGSPETIPCWVPLSLPCLPSCLTCSPGSASLLSHLHMKHHLRISLFFRLNLRLVLSVCLCISSYLLLFEVINKLSAWVCESILVRIKRQSMCFACLQIVLDQVLDNDGF